MVGMRRRGKNTGKEGIVKERFTEKISLRGSQDVKEGYLKS